MLSVEKQLIVLCLEAQVIPELTGFFNAKGSIWVF